VTDISRQHLSILGDPEVVSRDGAIFSGVAIFSSESLLLDVTFRPKISRRPKLLR